MWEKNILNKEKRKSKGPEVGVIFSVRSFGLKLENASESPGGLVNPQIACPAPGLSDQVVREDGTGDVACLTTF